MSTSREERAIALAPLIWQRKGKQRRSDTGETWIDHLCLFHQDSERSATFQPETGVYHCWAENKTYSLDEVEGELKALPPPTRNNILTPQKSTPIAEAFYDYTYPDGSPSHTHLRREFGDGSKEMPFRSPDGSSGRPKVFHPIYDESRLSPGVVIIVVEGEKCVDFVTSADDSYGETPIRALTAGSSSELIKYSPIICDRLLALTPKLILLWPDNDDPGIQAMRHLKQVLDRQHIAAAVVEPLNYNLAAKEDVADYLAAGGALSVVVNDYYPSLAQAATGLNTAAQRIYELVQSTVMLNGESMVFPRTQTPVKMENASLEALWLAVYDQVPPSNAIRELRMRLMRKGYTAPTDVAFRHYSATNAFWWRPSSTQPCFKVTADSIEPVPDPPDTMLIVPHSRPRFSTEVDLDGGPEDFDRFCNHFNLDDASKAMVLTWLVSAMTGRKAPILLFKGEASTGKTTIASFLCSLIDPDVPTLNAQQAERDTREFIRTAQRHPSLLLDNVSQVKPEFEDALSKLVTGETAALRTLYGDVIETIHLQRAICVTTTTWDISKGDLATRMWPIEPRLQENFMDEEDIDAEFQPLLPKLRGYLFKVCQMYYRSSSNFVATRTSLRIGGRVLQTLGYNVEAIADYIIRARAEIIVEGEPWLDAMVQLWGEIKEKGPYSWSPSDICKYIGDKTKDEPSTKHLANFIRPRQSLFPNYGFRLTWGRNSSQRFYKFEPSRDFHDQAGVSVFHLGQAPDQEAS